MKRTFLKLNNFPQIKRVVFLGFISLLFGIAMAFYSTILLDKIFSGFTNIIAFILFLALTILLSFLIYKIIIYLINLPEDENAISYLVMIFLLGSSLGYVFYLWNFPNLSNIQYLNNFLVNPGTILLIKILSGIGLSGCVFFILFNNKFIKSRQPLFILMICAFCIGTFFTTTRYNFGLANHTEDLPKVFRALDENYLTNDYFVNQFSSHISIRYYYVKLMAWLSSIFGVKPAFFGVCLFSNIAILFITGLFSFRLFNNKLMVGIISMFLLWADPRPYHLAGGYGIIYHQALSNFICAIFIYISFYQILIKNRLLAGSIFLGLATLIQAVFSIICFSIVLGGMLFVDLFQNYRWWLIENRVNFIKKYGSSIFVFAGISSILLIPYLISSQGYLTGEEFTRIYNYFRIPHHAVPSQFLNRESIFRSIFFISIIGRVLFYSNQIKNKTKTIKFFIGAAAIISMFFVFGYVFVELIPTRIFATLTPFLKIGPIITWFGVILIAGFFGGLIVRDDFMNPSTLLTLGGIIFYYSFFVQMKLGLYLLLIFIVLFIIAIIIRILNNINYKNKSQLNKITYKRFSSIISVMFISYAIILLAKPYTEYPLSSYFNQALREDIPSSDSIYGFIIEQTAPGAVFIAPDGMAEYLRTIPKRAVVIASKTYPANDEGLAEWYKQLFEVYACYDGTIHPSDSRGSFKNNFKKIDDACISMLIDKYDIDYAVLHQETDTSFPVVFSDEQYKIIELDS